MHVRFSAVLVFLVMVLLMAGCGQATGQTPTPETSAVSATTSAGAATGAGTTLSNDQGAVGPTQVASTGVLGADDSDSFVPGAAPGSTPAAPADLSSWQKYDNADYGIQFLYPPVYVQVKASEPAQPSEVSQIAFIDKQLVTSASELLGPPQLAVNVFDNSAGKSLDEWLAGNPRTSDRSKFSEADVDVAGVKGLQLSNSLTQIPNVFMYVAKGSFVYEFVPTGEFSDQMMASVKFTK